MTSQKKASVWITRDLLPEKILMLPLQEGSKVPAHSAVLASIPYFEAKLKEDWSEPGWNLNKKLDLRLPCAVDREVIKAFLKYAYGDVWSLTQLESSDATKSQVGRTFADQEGLPEIINTTSLCYLWIW